MMKFSHRKTGAGRGFRRTVLLACSLFCSAAWAGDHTSRPENVRRPDKIYMEFCSVCHGERGDGQSRARNALTPPPLNFTTPVAAMLSRERMINSVTHGRPGTAMMAWKNQLSKEEIEAVVEYIRTAFMRLPKSPAAAAPQPGGEKAAAADTGQGFPGGLTGDPAKGMDFFTKNCVPCHGTKGNGQGPRAYFIFPKPRNFTSVESRATLNRAALFKAIAQGKPGTVMPAWSKVISDQEIANVAEYVLQAFIQPVKGSRFAVSGA